MRPSTSPVDIRPDHLGTVQEILRAHLPAGVEVWVFGSRANWTTTDSSDLDLAVAGPVRLDYQVIADLEIAFEESNLPYSVDVVDLNSVSPDFKGIVDSQKVPLLPASDTGRDGWLYQPRFPGHWERQPLFSLAQWVNGLAFRNIQFSATGMPIIKIAEIKNGITDQTKFTQQEFDEAVRISPCDMLFSWSGQPESSIDVSWWHGPEGWLNQHIFRVTPGSSVDDEFFYYLLRHLKPNFIGIARNKQTTGLGHVTKRDLQEMEVALPPLPEQRSIAHILGTLDDKIELNRRMNQTLEEMARAICKDWFVDFGPVRAKLEGREPYLPPELWALFPDRLVDSELGEIPEGWGVKALGHVASIEKDSVNPGKSPSTLFSHFSIPAYDQGHIPRSEFGEGIKSTKSRVPPNVVLLSKLNPEIKRVWLVDVKADEDAVCSTEFLVLKPKQPFNRAYIYCYTMTQEFRLQLHGLVTGTSKSHQRAQPDAILRLSAIVPSAHLLHSFDQQAEDLLARIVALRREFLTLSMQRDTLLPRLVSGELSVNLTKYGQNFAESREQDWIMHSTQ